VIERGRRPATCPIDRAAVSSASSAAPCKSRRGRRTLRAPRARKRWRATRPTDERSVHRQRCTSSSLPPFGVVDDLHYRPRPAPFAPSGVVVEAQRCRRGAQSNHLLPAPQERCLRCAQDRRRPVPTPRAALNAGGLQSDHYRDETSARPSARCHGACQPHARFSRLRGNLTPARRQARSALGCLLRGRLGLCGLGVLSRALLVPKRVLLGGAFALAAGGAGVLRASHGGALPSSFRKGTGGRFGRSLRTMALRRHMRWLAFVIAQHGLWVFAVAPA
jgi:hypothetical protein